MTDALATARDWLLLDPDNAALLTTEMTAAAAGDEAALAGLTARFAGYLTFGTAGLRAPLGPGTTRMNRVVVQRAAAGIADFAREHLASPTVVIGYDARHGSKQFALDSAAVMTAAGCRVKLLPTVTPTPVLAFALKHLAADVGIMVTASHNPPADNGYKVYVGADLVDPEDAAGAYAQITTPVDQHIAEHIHRWNTAAQLPPSAETGWEILPVEIVDQYISAVRDFLDARFPQRGPRAQLRTVYTPLHGVGADTFERLFAACGFAAPTVVSQQRSPDPDFPTVAFPNPEEPGALQLAYATAAPDTDIILAHDPDADRLAVAVPVAGQWQRLTGDEMGLILGARLLPSLLAKGLTVANSMVSAPQLAALARHRGVDHVATPTGFKWICRVPNLGYGYEEALGYAVAPSLVNDKDGLSAAVVIADLAAELKASGSTVSQYLTGLHELVGPTVSDQVSVPVATPQATAVLVDGLRSAGPATLAGYGPVMMTDYLHAEVPLTQRYGPMNMLEFSTTGPIATRLMIRPSGTEPKVKCYVSVTAEPGTPLATVHRVMQQLRTEAATLVAID